MLAIRYVAPKLIGVSSMRDVVLQGPESMKQGSGPQNSDRSLTLDVHDGV